MVISLWSIFFQSTYLIFFLNFFLQSKYNLTAYLNYWITLEIISRIKKIFAITQELSSWEKIHWWSFGCWWTFKCFWVSVMVVDIFLKNTTPYNMILTTFANLIHFYFLKTTATLMSTPLNHQWTLPFLSHNLIFFLSLYQKLFKCK